MPRPKHYKTDYPHEVTREPLIQSWAGAYEIGNHGKIHQADSLYVGGYGENDSPVCWAAVSLYSQTGRTVTVSMNRDDAINLCKRLGAVLNFSVVGDMPACP